MYMGEFKKCKQKNITFDDEFVLDIDFESFVEDFEVEELNSIFVVFKLFNMYKDDVLWFTFKLFNENK
jgi:hypothetical protein